MGKHRIIIDCDPGIDDAVAIMLALASPEIEVLGLTCVAGNVGIERTSSNAAVIRNMMGRRDVPVYRGYQATYDGRPMRQAVVHGQDGLGDIGLSYADARPDEGDAVDFLLRSIMEHPPGEIALCVIGPMTNVAMAISHEPGFAPRVKELRFMGGAAFEAGNTTGAAEFNIHCDPHAAALVIGAGMPTTMFGLDVTRKMRIDARNLAALATAGDGTAASVAHRLLSAYGRKDPALHDPCVIASLIGPGLFQATDGRITVECQDQATFGQTRISPGKGAQVVTDGDAMGFFKLIGDRLGGARVASSR